MPWKTIEDRRRRAGLGRSPRTALHELKRIQSTDVVLPTEDGREFSPRRVVRPDAALRSGFLVAAVGYIAFSGVLAGRDRRLTAIAFASLLAAVIVDPMRAPLTHLNSGETLRATAEGSSGMVTVVDTGHDLQFRLDNYYVLVGSAVASSERRQGLMPLLLHPDLRRVMFIGMAMGISASAAAALNVPETTVIEVVPQVGAMARTYFARWNRRLLDRPDVQPVLDDGRRPEKVLRGDRSTGGRQRPQGAHANGPPPPPPTSRRTVVSAVFCFGRLRSGPASEPKTCESIRCGLRRRRCKTLRASTARVGERRFAFSVWHLPVRGLA